MIVVDSSALFSILLQEERAVECADALRDADELAISAGTIVEVLIVAEGQGIADQMRTLIAGLELKVWEVTEHMAFAAGDAFRRFGKGRHPARLNFGDCFSYALASELKCPLLYVGDDFSQTDLQSAI